MGCLLCRTEDGGVMFLCGEENLQPTPCRDCGFESDFLCDYPVGNDKTCDAMLCEKHAVEIAPGVHYCKPHYNEFKQFENSGGVIEVLKNVVPFSRKDRARFI